MNDLLTIIIPAYNESETIEKIVDIVSSVPLAKEIIVVDDGSTDGTRQKLSRMTGRPSVKIILMDKNSGKGSAIKTGIQSATGKSLVIQDADLEYDPFDFVSMMKKMNESGVSVVYGSRFLNKKRVTSGWHRLVNYSLTLWTNLLYGSRLTDMETCYKMLDTQLAKGLNLESPGFEIETEITAKILKQRIRIVEVPVSYKGRSYHEGKKIGWQDGIKAVFYLLYYRFQK